MNIFYHKNSAHQIIPTKKLLLHRCMFNRKYVIKNIVIEREFLMKNGFEINFYYVQLCFLICAYTHRFSDELILTSLGFRHTRHTHRFFRINLEQNVVQKIIYLLHSLAVDDCLLASERPSRKTRIFFAIYLIRKYIRRIK